MSLINWEDNYSVGVVELDTQHKKMFEIINRFYESMRELKDKDIKEELLKELSDWGKLHLGTEEKYFEEFDYPDKEAHKKIHDSYREKIREFVDKKDDTLLSFEIIDFLEDWWLGHIASEDKQYQDFFNSKGLK